MVVESTPQPELAHRQKKAAVNRGNTLPLTRAPRRLPVQGQLYQPPLGFTRGSRSRQANFGRQTSLDRLGCVSNRLAGRARGLRTGGFRYRAA